MIQKLAIDRNMTLKELSILVKLSYPHFMNLLNGNRDITPKIQHKIENALKLNREERYALNEAVFISNSKIIIPKNNNREYVLRLIYWINVKRNFLSQDQVDQCMSIIKNQKTAGGR